MTYTCVICDEEQKKDEQVICSKCNGISCRICFQTFLLNSNLNLSCMHCRINLSEDFVYENTCIGWVQTVYSGFRNNLIFEKEQARLSEDQSYAELYINAKTELRKIEHMLKHHKGDFKSYDYLKRRRHFYLDVVKNFGKIKTNNEKIEKKLYIKSCVNKDCKGFLNVNFKCGLCSTIVCKTCHENISDNKHVCSKEIIASVKAIKLEAKPCPTCSTLISKIDGCDQMWCTQCHTTFSWNTGIKETGITHNPHFYEWARRNGGLARHPGDMPICNQYPGIWDIYISFDENTRRANGSKPSLGLKYYESKTDAVSSLRIITEIYRYIQHMKQIIMDRIPLQAADNYDLRVRYLVNELPVDKFKQLLQQRDIEFRKSIASYYIYDMIYQATGDIFRNLKDGRDHIHIRSDFKRLFQYGNECLRRLEDRYMCKFQMINYL